MRNVCHMEREREDQAFEEGNTTQKMVGKTSKSLAGERVVNKENKGPHSTERHGLTP